MRGRRHNTESPERHTQLPMSVLVGRADPRRRTPRLAVLFAALVISRFAYAERNRTIELVVAGDSAAAGKVLTAVQASLARRGLEVISSIVPRIDPPLLIRDALARAPAAGPESPLAYLWLDLDAPRPGMYLLATQDALVYVRALDVSARPDTVEIELIRFVVDESVQAILKGHALGVNRKEFEKSLIVPAVQPLPPPQALASAVSTRGPRWSIAGGYTASALSMSRVAQGPELSADLRWTRLRLGASFSQRLPLTVSGPDARARLLSSSFRVFATAVMTIRPRLLGAVAAGGGIDVTHVAPEAIGATAPFWVSDALLRGIASLQRTFGGVAVSAGLGAELDLVEARYEIIRAGQATVFWRPWRWRPVATLCVSFAY